MRTDAELLEQFTREGAQEAYAELVRRHIGMVYGAALRHVGGDAHLAQDVTQTVFTALARKASGVAHRGALAGWLYLSTHHAAAQAVRTERRRRVREEAHAMHERLIKDDAASLEWEQVRPVLDEAMRELGEADREAVLLRYFEARPFSQVGAALNVSEDAARMRVERALDKLRAQLERRGIASASAALGAALTSHASAPAPAALMTAVTACAGVTVVGAGIFMKATLAMLSATSVAAVGAAFYQNARAEKAESVATTMVRQRDTAAAGKTAAEQRASGLATQVAKLESERSSAAMVTARPATVSAVPVAGTLVLSDNQGLGLNVEQAPEAIATQVRQAIAKTHAAFFPKMGWSDAQRERFQQAWVERKLREKEFFDTHLAQKGTPPDGPAMRGFMRQAEAEFNTKVEADFGTGTVAALESFREKGSFRTLATEAAVRLLNSPAPLTGRQVEWLIDLMADNARNAAGKLDLRALNIEPVLAQAQGVLTPAQLTVLREVEAENRRQRELEMRAASQRIGIYPPTK